MDAVERARAVVSDLEAELAKTTAERLEVLVAVQKLSAAVDARKEIAAKLAPLNRRAKELSIHIVDLTRRLEAEERQAMLAREQAAAIARQAAALANACLAKKHWFEVVAPDGRVLRVRHAGASLLQSELLPKYEVRAQLFGTNENGEGGFSVAIGTDPAAVANEVLRAVAAT
jgi:hypothetical protein